MGLAGPIHVYSQQHDIHFLIYSKCALKNSVAACRHLLLW